MVELLSRVRQNLLEHCGVRPDDRLLVAVSGGVDSVVLLHILVQLKTEFGWELVVAHYNHGLRGAESDADAAFVRRLAAELGLKCHCGRGHVRRRARATGESIEMAARQLRHEFLYRTALRVGATKIALGHNADDQVELFFLRVLRGAGGEGLSGMRWQAPSPAIPKTGSAPEIMLVRPLLDVPRTEIEGFAAAHNIRFRTDSSNLSTEYVRNWIRLELIPRLRERFGTRLYTVIPRIMEIIGAESEFVTERAQAVLSRRNPCAFSRLPVAIQRQMLRLQLIDSGFTPDFDTIEKLRTGKSTHITLAPGTSVYRDRFGRLYVEHRAPGTAGAEPSIVDTMELELNRPAGRVCFHGVAIRWSVLPAGSRKPRPVPGRVEYFDADAVGKRVRLRHWRAGDRFRPIGMRAAAKLQDLFVNNKVPREVRHRLLLAESETGEIFWVEGLRIGEQFKVGPHTRRLLRWAHERTPATA